MNLQPLDSAGPVLAFSYSSRGFPDLVELLKLSLNEVPSAYLISLFDYFYLLRDLDLFVDQDDRIRIWDSGGYEVRRHDDLSVVVSAMPQTETWNEALYVEAANAIPFNRRDVIVSYDGYSEPLEVNEQIELGLHLFNKIEGQFRRDLLIHAPAESDPVELADLVALHAGQFDILGLTEKEIAPTWLHGVRFVHRLKSELVSRLGEQAPLIHLFGCFDPKSIIRFCCAGVDMFDGLSWLRYFFLDNNALYVREYEYRLRSNQLDNLDSTRAQIVLHNINQIAELHADLTYASVTEDYTAFAEHMHAVSTAVSGGQRRAP